MTEAKQDSEPPRAVLPLDRVTSNPVIKAVALALFVGALLLAWHALGDDTSATPIRGEVQADHRQSVRLGRAGVAVIEPNAQLSWEILPDGSPQVEQQSGSVFYRVDPAKSLVVHTARGRVGGRASFQVAIDDSVVVSVFEGTVQFVGAGAGAIREVAAGQRLVAGQDGTLRLADDAADSVR